MQQGFMYLKDVYKRQGEDYLKRVSGGVLADGVNSFIAGIFNSFPNSIFAQNNGIIPVSYTHLRIILAGTSGERSLRKHRSLSVSMRILIVSLISLKVLTETTILS